jgi:hypothetical protein
MLKLNFLRYLREATKETRPVVMTYGRMNPGPTIGHQVLLDKIHGLADAQGAHHEVVLSHSQDPKKNPLSIDQKLEHARRFFPQTNFVGSSKATPTILHHLSRLHAAGHPEAHIVVGADRAEEFEKLANQYNGKDRDEKGVPYKHGYFNFKKIKVHSAGDRDPDAEGVEGMSSSKMRMAAQANDFDNFKKGVPTHVPEEHARKLFNDTRNGMMVNESETGAVGGLGFNTGNPSVEGNGLSNYTDTNTTNSDQKNDILHKWIQDNHAKLHAKLGFKEFSPKDMKSKGKQ